jgi:hypothetical protein
MPGPKMDAMSVYEKEALAILHALKKWRHFFFWKLGHNQDRSTGSEVHVQSAISGRNSSQTHVKIA